MERNYNRIDLPLLAVRGSNPDISCDKCPSACCRVGMALPLSDIEAASLVQAGTELTKLEHSRKERKEKKLGKATYYSFDTDCGNLVKDEYGNMGCSVFENDSPVRPNVCRAFKVGSVNCAIMQQVRVNRGEDVFVSDEDSELVG